MTRILERHVISSSDELLYDDGTESPTSLFMNEFVMVKDAILVAAGMYDCTEFLGISSSFNYADELCDVEYFESIG